MREGEREGGKEKEGKIEKGKSQTLRERERLVVDKEIWRGRGAK